MRRSARDFLPTIVIEAPSLTPPAGRHRLWGVNEASPASPLQRGKAGFKPLGVWRTWRGSPLPFPRKPSQQSFGWPRSAARLNRQRISAFSALQA